MIGPVLSALRIAVRSVLRAKLRAFLTILGILIGVAAVVIVTALGTGVQDQVVKAIQSMGSNTIFIFGKPAPKGGARAKAGTGGRLTEADGNAIMREAQSVGAIAPLLSAPAQLVVADRNTNTAVIGTTRDYLKVRSYEVAKGDMWSEADERLKTKVCVVGATVADNLFGNEDPIGRIVRIGKYPFRIVGLLERKGQSLGGEDPDDRVLVPSGSFRSRILPLPSGRVFLLLASATELQTTAGAQRQIESILRQRHHIAEGDESDFQVRTQAEFMEMQEQIFGTLNLLLIGIAVVSLVVGGIGVMNIMLVSVTERTREIGIRMAIGAQEFDIMVQFLVEALVLCSIGGLAGTAVGIGVIKVLVSSLGWSMALPPEALVAALLTSFSIGILFGFFPARRAAQLDPIEALRHE